MERISDCRVSRKKKLFLLITLFVVFVSFSGVLFELSFLFPDAGAKLHEGSRGITNVIDLEGIPAADWFPFLRDVKFKGTMTMNTRVSLDDARRDSLPVMAEVLLQGAVATWGSLGIDLRARDLKLTVKGVYHFAEDRIDIMTLQAHLSEKRRLNVRGTVYHIRSDRPVMDLKAEGSISVSELKDILSGPAVKWLQDLDIEAEGDVSLSVAGTLTSPRIAGNLLVRGERLTGKDVVVRGYRAEVPFRYASDALNLHDVLVRANEILYTRRGSNDALRFYLEQTDVRIPSIEYRNGAMKSGVMEARIGRAGAGTGDRVLHEEQGIVIRGAAAYDSWSRKAKFSAISLDTDVVKNITGDAAVTLDDPVTINANLLYDNLSLEEILQGQSPLLPLPGLSGVHGSGSVRAAVNISMPEQGEGRVAAALEADIRDAGFSSEDETVIAEGIAAHATGTVGFSLPFRHIDFALDSRSGGFELLAGMFYGNFAEKSLDISALGTYAVLEDMLSLQRVKLDLAGIGRIVLAGEVTGMGDRPHFQGDISLSNFSNREGYDFLVRETFREKYPFLAGIVVDGESEVKLSVVGTADSFTAHGTVSTARMNIRGKEPGRIVQDLNVSLPVSFSRGGPHPVPGEKDFGFLRIQSVSWGALITGEIEVFPVIGANTLLFRDNITIPVFGGTIILKNVSYTDLLSPARRLSLAVEVNRVDLARTTSALEIPQFSGDLSGMIPSVAFAGNRLETEGEIHLSLFDGSMRIGGLSMDRVFSPIPSLTCSIDMEDINLARLTSTFDFGHISGVVRGSVKDLVIVRGQAQSFSALLESVRKKGISQKISVEALKKISILGSGSSATILDRGIYQLFKEYRYEKLGFRGVLRNDNLRLLGIETQDSRGYLVKGGLLPPRVDVINYNQDISFSELVRRLKRVTQAQHGS
ncbi:MAG: hypothetical protein JSU90_05440 [Nitrospiraceae bacterium]|nr:MAG: hypothetical protein JSU90_05440 [Nitrospiraceae bacterium]